MLDSVEQFAAALEFTFRPQNHATVTGTLYCPSCADKRKVQFTRLYPTGLPDLVAERDAFLEKTRVLASAVCLQCHKTQTLVRCQSSAGVVVIVVPDTAGGLSTKHSPVGVAYYLDQAARCRCVGANSAAMAMYRAALEHVLHEQGFHQRMLGPKLDALEKAIAANTAPAWASRIDPLVLKHLKDLGNSSIHADDGDVGRQAEYDAELMQVIEATLVELLATVYEEPKQREARAKALAEASANVKKRPSKP